jgi:integrase
MARLEHPVQVGTGLDLPPETAARIAAAVPANTRRNWESRWRAYALWCLLTDRAPLPASGETLAAYLDARSKGLAVPDHLRHAVGRGAYQPLTPSSMAAHLGSLRAAHRIAGYDSPDPYLATMVIKARAAELADDPDAEVGIRQATPVRGRDLARMIEAIDTGTPAGLRDRALLLLLYKTGRRGKEIAGLNLTDVRDAESPDPGAPPLGLRVTFRTSKTNPQGLNREDIAKVKRTGGDYCPYGAVRAWRLYLTGQGYKKGPLFPRLDRHGNLGTHAAGGGGGEGRITPKTVHAIVRARAEAAGLVPESGYREGSDGLPVLVRITAHSTRRGFVTDAFTRPDADPEKIGRQAGFAPGSRTLYHYRDVELGWDDDPTDGLITA